MVRAIRKHRRNPVVRIADNFVWVLALAAPAITREKITMKKLNRWQNKFSMNARSWLMSQDESLSFPIYPALYMFFVRSGIEAHERSSGYSFNKLVRS